MRDIQLLLLAVLLVFAGACGDTGMRDEGQLTASFQEQELHFYENSGVNRIKVELSAPAAYEQTVTVVVKSEINSRAGKDYLLENREVRIGKGEKSGELELELLDDGEVNDARSIVLSIFRSSAVAADPVKGECRIQLLDDESDSSVEFEESARKVLENAGTVFIPFRLEGTPNGEVIVQVAVKPLTSGEPAVEGTHFTIVDKEIVFNPETDNPADFGVSIALIDDDDINPDRSFVLEITRVYNAVRITERSTSVVTVSSDDLAVRWGVAAVGVEEHPEGKNTLQLPIRLQGIAIENLTIGLEVIGEHAGELSFVMEAEVVLPLGEDSVLVDVTPVYDPAVTGDRNVQVRIKSVEGYAGLEGPVCGMTVYNYDADVTADISTYYAGSNLTAPLVMPFSLSNPVRHNVEIKLSGESAGGKRLEFPASFIIPAGKTTGTVSVPVYPDYSGHSFTLAAEPVSGITQDHLQITGSVNVETGAELSRSAWTINSFSTDAPNEGATNGGQAMHLMDGKSTTFWHSRWSTVPTLPHWIIIDMEESVHIEGFKIQRRLNNGNTKTVEFSVSNDLSTWLPAGSIVFTNVGASDNIREYSNTTQFNLIGRYLKINMPDTWATTDKNLPCSIAEVYVNGFVIP